MVDVAFDLLFLEENTFQYLAGRSEVVGFLAVDQVVLLLQHFIQHLEEGARNLGAH